MTTTRRNFLSSAAAATLLPATASATAAAPVPLAAADSFTFCFNTSTIREQTQDIVEQVQIAADAGYTGIEPWMRHLSQYVEAGGSLADLRKKINDAGLTVESAIGFAQWIADEPERRKQGLEDAKRDMDILTQIGGLRIAAPPTGATKGPKLDLFVVAERYRTLLEIGDEIGVVPQLEVWGHSTNLSRLGESVMACVEASHPKACLLPDVYHIFKGGSQFGGLALLNDSAIHAFHMNDYPDSPVREEMNDSHRVYPGDGIAPLSDILNMIGGNGRSVALSLELFNRDYWKQDALTVAKTGLAKMKAAVAAAG
jgi:sugar phosphate isomerase/epimerase